ncbi:MAG: aldehyde dehydrogenase family protein, partial [Actinomycetota bacterium]|nr:aldehyde dehydrogenase family protein [Actinomycetota bacterium]
MSDLEPAPAQPLMPAWAYAAAPESRDIVRLQDRYGLFIGGEFVEPKSGRWFPTIDPSNETVLAEVAEAGEEDVDVAVTAARSAYV